MWGMLWLLWCCALDRYGSQTSLPEAIKTELLSLPVAPWHVFHPGNQGVLDHAEGTAVCRETVQHCAVRQLQLPTGCQQVDVGRGSPPGLRRQVTTLLVYRTSTFVHLTISPESPAQGEESNGAQAEVQAAAVVLHRGLGSPIDCPS